MRVTFKFMHGEMVRARFIELECADGWLVKPIILAAAQGIADEIQSSVMVLGDIDTAVTPGESSAYVLGDGR